jgi:hypothetical protein
MSKKKKKKKRSIQNTHKLIFIENEVHMEDYHMLKRRSFFVRETFFYFTNQKIPRQNIDIRIVFGLLGSTSTKKMKRIK